MDSIKSEIAQSVNEVEVIPIPYYRLCCAVLFKALEDIEDLSNIDSHKYLYAKTAYDWIFVDDLQSPMPLEFICEVLQLSKEEIREKARCILSKELSVKQASGLRPSIKN